MAINEVFPNPTVKKVIFQIRFPNLFYMEAKIGDYQLRIMDRFPKSSLLVKRQFLIAELTSDKKMPDLAEVPGEPGVNKIWHFESPDGVELNVNTDSVDISSSVHKTYNNPSGQNRFRDIIKLAIDHFLSLTGIPILTRVGLRYIDACPVPGKDNTVYAEWYKSAFPLDRFPLSEAIEMIFHTCTRRDQYFLGFTESFKDDSGKLALTLDFDGYAENVKSEDYLRVTDDLHALVVQEFEASIRERLINHMRQPKE